MCVNRGQAVVSFGQCGKDHAIAEFLPATWAYQQVGVQGFRTLCKIDGDFFEPFQKSERSLAQDFQRTMWIEPERVTVQERSETLGLTFRAAHFAVVDSPVPALVRRMTITNAGELPKRLSVLDGLPLPDLVSQVLRETRESRGHPGDEEPVLPVPTWKAHASMIPHLFRVFRKSTGRNVPDLFRPSDLRNTLPSEAKQREWDDVLVQACMGQRRGQSIKDLHCVALVSADAVSGEGSDPMVDRLRQEIVEPLNTLIEKALRHCTALHAEESGILATRVKSGE